MSSFLDDLMKNVGPELTKQMSSHLEMNEEQAQTAVTKLAPIVLGGLKRQADAGGEDRVNHIIQKYGREGALDDLEGHIQRGAQEANPDPTLGGLLGDAGPQASTMLAEKMGISAGAAMKLLPILAPIILGALKKQVNSPASTNAGAASGGGGGGLLTSILDRDGDGSILDDVAGMIFKTGGSAVGGGGGLLAKILGMLFGRRG